MKKRHWVEADRGSAVVKAFTKCLIKADTWDAYITHSSNGACSTVLEQMMSNREHGRQCSTRAKATFVGGR